MKRCKQDEEFANTGPRPFPSKEPNPVTLQAIREADAFLATGESGRFVNGADLIDAALKPLKCERIQPPKGRLPRKFQIGEERTSPFFVRPRTSELSR